MKKTNATKTSVLAILRSRGLRFYDYSKMSGLIPSKVTRMLQTPAKTFSLGRLAQMADLLNLSDAEILSIVDTLRTGEQIQDGSKNVELPDEGSMEERPD